MSAPIGIFDSGLGGLTVARAVFDRLPAEAVLYVGDTARVPYGPKSPETVRRYSLEILRWLLAHRVKAVVVACNTSTAHALDALQAASPVPVIGVIAPGAEAAVRAAPEGPVGVIGTAGTIGSGAYAAAIARLAPGVRVVERACPLFVPLVEEGWFDRQVTELVAGEYLAPLRAAKVRAVVLGCTHYPLLAPLLQRVLGAGVTLVDGGAAAAEALARELGARGLLEPGPGPGPHRFCVTDDTARFLEVGRRFVGEHLEAAELVTLDAG
ncbi:MAG: glutamate racemase [Gemmatimonadales bacterium]|nr:glutamate racemase [Gemmatimonadales bacterium]